MKIAVYGTLKKGYGNHSLISGSKFLGETKTEKIYDIYDLGPFPGVKRNGSTAVTVEVYEVDNVTAKRVDILEGYIESNPSQGLYDKEVCKTEFGDAEIYIYNGEPNSENKIENGEWKQ